MKTRETTETTTTSDKPIVPSYFNRHFLETAYDRETATGDYVMGYVNATERTGRYDTVIADFTLHDGSNTALISLYANPDKEQEIESLLERLAAFESAVEEWAHAVRRAVDAHSVLKSVEEKENG